MSIEDLKKEGDFFLADNKTEITIKHGGKEIKFYANALSWLQSMNIGIQAAREDRNQLALLVSESITDADGNKFTYDEILKLKEDVSKTFFNAVTKINKKVKTEKKN